MGKTPQFLDKRIYNDEQSYSVSSSFRGILRLSPNDKFSSEEKPEFQSVLEDLQTNYYHDAIKFENDTEEAPSIDDRFICVSDSTGYLVNFRISSYGIEFDNLGVLGKTYINNTLSLFTNENDDKPNFTLSGSKMPTIQDKSNNQNYLVKKDGNWRYEDTKVLDYFLLDKNLKITKNQLLAMNHAPTGSIHWLKMTLDEYKLLKDGIPNDTSLDFEKYAHLRDFLICDGRQYYKKDFPDLYNTLFGEKIIYQRLSDDGKIIQPNTHTNNQEETFRVPDLRHMFISSVYANGFEDYSKSELDSIHNAENETGSYCPDNSKNVLTNPEMDDHRHFLAVGTYQPNDLLQKYLNFKQKGFTGLGTSNPPKQKTPSKVQFWTLHNHPYKTFTVGSVRGMQGFNANVGTHYSALPVGDNISCNIFCAAPSKYDYYTSKTKPSIKDELACYNSKYITLGKSSNNFSSSNQSNSQKNSSTENVPNYYAMIPLIKI